MSPCRSSLAAAFLIILLTTPGLVQGGLEFGPQNVADYVGTTFVLQCITDGVPGANVRWFEFVTDPAGSLISDGTMVMPGHPNAARYQILTDGARSFNLQISSSVIADGGYYMCQDSNASPPAFVQFGAHLVIIEAPPNCTTTMRNDGYVIEGQYYSAECNIRFRATEGRGIAVNMFWTGPPPYNPGYAATNVSAWSGVGFTSTRTQDTQSFQCWMNFTTQGFIGPDSATNAPTWNTIFPFNQMFVHWAPTNMTAYPIQASYEIGDTITCWADAFPSPSYMWQSLRTSQQWFTQSFTTTVDMVGYQLMRCQARNTMIGYDYTKDYFLDVYVNAPTTPVTTTTPATTTTPPPVSPCPDLTGRWEATFPNASLCLTIDHTNQDGALFGLLRNGSDTYWLQISGRTREGQYDELGWSAIWPSSSIGVSSYAAECHRCYGNEILLADAISRTTKDSVFCAAGNDVIKSQTYTYSRVKTSWPCSSSASQMLKNVRDAGLLRNPDM